MMIASFRIIKDRISMKKEELLSMEIVSNGNKQAYVKPICEKFYLETQAMMISSVRGVVDNDDVGEDPTNPWYTSQD